MGNRGHFCLCAYIHPPPNLIVIVLPLPPCFLSLLSHHLSSLLWTCHSFIIPSYAKQGYALHHKFNWWSASEKSSLLSDMPSQEVSPDQNGQIDFTTKYRMLRIDFGLATPILFNKYVCFCSLTHYLSPFSSFKHLPSFLYLSLIL